MSTVAMPAAGAATQQVVVDYPAASEIVAGSDGTNMLLALDANRGVVGVRGRIRNPILFRDAFATMAAILGSDLRYKGKDRAAYLAYLAKQGKRASAQIWEAQKKFLEESLGDDEKKTSVLDPILTVHPDEVSLEVFSRDESAYARLAFGNDLFEAREAAHGTTHVDLSPKVVEAIERLRTWQPVRLDAGTTVSTGTPGGTRSLDVPYAWLRGFLQVQSAATLPATTAEIAAIDLYNVLFALRTRRAKKPPRALRFELVPGVPPRLVLEPWEVVLECHGPAYTGRTPRVIRTFGRQRLSTLQRLLPHAKSVRVQLLGAGLPTFWTMDLGGASLSLGLTGWSESGWSSAAAFDSLMPPPSAAAVADEAHRHLMSRGPTAFEEIVKALGHPAEVVRGALQLECLRGRVLYDLAKRSYRPRALLARPVDDAAIRYGSPREARAHRLLAESGAAEVRITKIHEIAGEGTEIHGEIDDREAHRAFKPKFLLDVEGRVREASCGCPAFKRAGMREGPCEHMIALRLSFSRERAKAEALRNTPEGRKLIRAETRTWVRRDERGVETVYRVSLDGKLVTVQWGERTAEPRQQRLWYDNDAEAREAYFARLERLSSEGFVDADAS